MRLARVSYVFTAAKRRSKRLFAPRNAVIWRRLPI
jgi:hypothetical protein